jgi:glycosyltransferase involved in cell wall biosynthesis
MKIIYLHQYFNTPAMSGGTRSYEMARRWVAAGHEVHMITSERQSGRTGAWRVEDVDGITVHWYPVAYDNKMSFARRIIAFFLFAWASGRRAVEIGGDVVFATSTPLTIALPGVAAKTRLRVPMVFEVRDLWPETPIALGALKGRVPQTLARRLERWAYKHSAAIVALSPGMADGVKAQGYPPERIHVIPNACDLDLFGVGSDEGDRFRVERPWLRDRPLVVYAGTFGYVNDARYLVSVAKELADRDCPAAILMVGDGAEKDVIVAEAKRQGVLGSNLFIEEPLPKAEMPALLNAAAVCTSVVAPIAALEANSANKFFDALAAGRPVAINHGGWQADLITELDLGAVLSRTPASAARQLADLLGSDQRELIAMGRRARRLAESDFSREQLSAQLLDVLRAATRTL